MALTRIRRFPILIALALAAGCATVPDADDALSPRDAIVRAAERAPDGVAGRFRFTVRATGRQDGYLYLNSELDYRDQRCLTAEIDRPLVAAFERRYPEPVGKILVVTGIARRVKIVFVDEGLPPDRYYCQTHVKVTDLRQVELLGR